MNAPKRARSPREIVSLAYATNPSTPTYRRRAEQSSVPGPLFDVCVVGTFLVLVLGYYHLLPI